MSTKKKDKTIAENAQTDFTVAACITLMYSTDNYTQCQQYRQHEVKFSLDHTEQNVQDALAIYGTLDNLARNVATKLIADHVRANDPEKVWMIGSMQVITCTCKALDHIMSSLED